MRTLSENRFPSIRQRKDFSVVPEDFFKASLRGRYLVEHRGHSLMKEPRDLTIYQRLLWDVKPANIIEMGTYAEGSALWMSDMLKMMEIDSTIYTIDYRSYVSDDIKKLCSPNVHFLWGDAYEIEKIFSNEFIQSLKHPLVVIEDCHVNTLGILEFFHKFMQSGDYFIVEDACPLCFSSELRPGVESFESLDDFEPWGAKTEDIPEYLQICTVRDLKNTPHIFSPPRLIHNRDNHVVVFTGRTGEVGNHKTHYLFDPLQGMDTIYDLNDIEFNQHVSYLKGSMHISESIQQPPQEATVILLDVSESMKRSTRPFFSQRRTNALTKVTVARHFFAAFCRQTAAYGFKHALALMLFNDKIVNKCMLSECIEALAHILIPQSEKFQTSGDTFLWDAIYSACKQLQKFSLKYPKSVKRILCLTDGSDSGSERNVLDCANILCENAIVLDMILIGRNNADARGLSYISGGFPFYFEDISDAMCIAEAESLVSVRARQLSHPVMSSTDINKTTFDKYKKLQNAILIVKNVPPLPRAMITSHVLTTTEADRDNEAYRYLRMKDPFQDERQLLNPISALDKARGLGKERRSARNKRILKELLYIARKKVTTFDDQPIAIFTFALPDVDKWKGIMPCPEKSPYGEKILFSVSFPPEYPATPPQIRFKTPILHPNISGDGLVCHYLLKNSWYSQDYSMRTILREISLLLKIPIVQDSADSIRMEEYSRDESQFNEKSSELSRCVQVVEPIIDIDSDSELPEEGEVWYLED